MAQVLELATSRIGFVSPNPYVGCMFVIQDKVISIGVHKGSGSPHAEIEAFKKLPLCYDPSKIVIYVNLEPCCHFNKRTPPCAQFLIKQGFRNVVIGSLDPNPNVSGKGVKLLKESGVSVTHGVLQKECEEVNKIFFKNMRSKVPYFHGKIATSCDGKIALSSGQSKWITSSQSRERVHELRLMYDAILVGKGTFIQDSPKLNTRKDNLIIKNNKKIIIGNYSEVSKLIPLDERDNYFVISKLNERDNNQTNKQIVIDNLKVIFFLDSISEVFPTLYDLGIKSVLVEGGGKVFSSFLSDEIFDEVSIFKAPSFIGKGRSFSDSISLNDLSDHIRIKNPSYEILGEDIHLRGFL